MTEKNLYLVHFNGKDRLIEAETLTSLKTFLLTEAGFTAKVASSHEVKDFFVNGGKAESFA